MSRAMFTKKTINRIDSSIVWRQEEGKGRIEAVGIAERQKEAAS